MQTRREKYCTFARAAEFGEAPDKDLYLKQLLSDEPERFREELARDVKNDLTEIYAELCRTLTGDRFLHVDILSMRAVLRTDSPCFPIDQSRAHC